MIYKTEIKKPGQRRRDGKLENILAAAMRLVSDHGLENLTINRLAEALDYTPGALYRYYSSKDAIIAGLQIKVIRDLHLLISRAGIQAAGEKKENPGLTSLVASAKIYRLFAIKAPAQFQLLSITLSEPKVILQGPEAGKVAEATFDLLKEVGGFFEQAEKEKSIQPGNNSQRPLIYFSGLQGILQLEKLRRLDEKFFNTEKLYSEMIMTLLTGWGADKGTQEKINSSAVSIAEKII